ncbi:hypothetical protein [Kutzneria sp. 744]|uniref:hypothetical protein n=1 Tax=Kutzneria sp. (strain 744) TaxID=345341 RepID=UPI0003EECA04|nr:hypothetical protein [Kutzneria sp. 744]EWM16540.1 hypothetical protein KUTG_06844 [Kutzneria sp. 744]
MALLVALVLLAVAAGSLLVLTRRRPVARAGSPARDRSNDLRWVERAELAAGQLHPYDDAAGVLAELRAAEADVDAINRALAALRASQLRRTRDRLAARLAPDGAGAPELTSAFRAVSDRLATAERLRAARDALTTRMHACVTGLERVRDSGHSVGTERAVELVELRVNLAEVRVLARGLPEVPARGRP